MFGERVRERGGEGRTHKGSLEVKVRFCSNVVLPQQHKAIGGGKGTAPVQWEGGKGVHKKVSTGHGDRRPTKQDDFANWR